MDDVCPMGKKKQERTANKQTHKQPKLMECILLFCFEAMKKNIGNWLIISRDGTFHAQSQRASTYKILSTLRSSISKRKAIEIVVGVDNC